MKNFLGNYKMSIILLLSVILGGILGVALGPKATVLEPFGQVFLNLIFTIIVPLVFFSVTSAIVNMTNMNRFKKIMFGVVIVFMVTSLLAAILTIVSTLMFNPTKGLDASIIKNILTQAGGEISKDTKKLSLAQQLVSTITVGDFSALFSRSNMLQIIIFSILFGVSTILAGEKATIVKNFLNAGMEIMMKMVNLIMYYAPIGLGCYFASVVGQLGTQILQGYLKVFVLYLGITAIYYFGFYSIYAYISAKSLGVKAFWRNIMPTTLTALATCSSAATIPVNLDSTKKIGVPEEVAETVIPLGINIHKDGSVIGGVLKVMFLFAIFGNDLNNIPALLSILGVGLLVGAVMAAIPGGGLIAEMLILSVYGFPPEALPIIAVISTIIDAPATMLNSTGNTACAMLISRLIDGKKWMKV